MYCVVLALAAFAASFLMVTCVHLSKENEVLKAYVEFYRRQSQSAIDGWVSCTEKLNEAYKVLEEYELLEEVNGNDDGNGDT